MILLEYYMFYGDADFSSLHQVPKIMIIMMLPKDRT